MAHRSLCSLENNVSSVHLCQSSKFKIKINRQNAFLVWIKFIFQKHCCPPTKSARIGYALKWLKTPFGHFQPLPLSFNRKISCSVCRSTSSGRCFRHFIPQTTTFLNFSHLDWKSSLTAVALFIFQFRCCVGKVQKDCF